MLKCIHHSTFSSTASVVFSNVLRRKWCAETLINLTSLKYSMFLSCAFPFSCTWDYNAVSPGGSCRKPEARISIRCQPKAVCLHGIFPVKPTGQYNSSILYSTATDSLFTAAPHCYCCHLRMASGI